MTSAAPPPSHAPSHMQHADYQWLPPREAILLRPDTHVGRVEAQEVTRTVLDAATLTPRTVTATVSAALEKLFDEILTNAIDHRVRDSAMTRIDVSFDPDGTIHVSNDGSKTITLSHWPGTEVRTPQVLFHEINAGSNLVEVNAHNVGGRNGVGATIVNYMSKRFTLSLCNADEKQTYSQTFRDNGAEVGEPKLGAYKKKTAHTAISFLPDYERLTMPPPPVADEVRALLVGRAVDAAACTAATVYVDGARIPIKTLRQYALAYGGEFLGQERAGAAAEGADGDAATAALGVSLVVTTGAATATHVCFVNGVRCRGTLYDAVLKNLAAALAAKAPSLGAKHLQALVAEHCSVFISARLNTPSFGSQSKDVLDTPVSRFGFAIPDCASLAKKIEKLDVVREQLAMREQLANGKLAKKALSATGGQRLSKKIKKYERATEVGHGGPCTLWVTEGDSAKAMVVSGFAKIGRKRHGVYPLRGKLLNVWDLKPTDALKNTEICELLSILHLDPGKTYDAASARRLPYKLMIITDQDDDGSHIFGLVLAVFHHFFPTLLEAVPDFVRRFVTPVIKVRLPAVAPKRKAAGDGASSGAAPSSTLEFFALSTYRAWEAGRDPAARKPQSIHYYKGLGTNSTEEAVAYFGDMARYTVVVRNDGPRATDAMRTAFSKAKEHVQERRVMLRAVDASSAIDYSGDAVAVEDFCEQELVRFWDADNKRSIPSAVDGLKPAQRKVLHTLLRSGQRLHKVAQLAADVAKVTNYHHGEQSLAEVIVKMAQTFMGSNQINLLVPKGQFGNRHGEKPSSPRYIFTELAPVAKAVFRPEDAPVLDYLRDEGEAIEPRHFVPVVPWLLINGSEGIGTGYATTVPSFAVADVIAACRALCDAIEGATDDADADALVQAATLPQMVPHAAGFDGTATLNPEGTAVEFVGVHAATAQPTTVRVTELPPGVKTNAVRDALLDLDCVDDAVSHSIGETVDLHVTFASAEAMPKTEEALVKLLKLRSTASLTNMHAFEATSEGALTHFADARDVVRHHARARLALYRRRFEHDMGALRDKAARLQRELDFIRRVVAGEIVPTKMRRAELLALLGEEHGPELLRLSLDELTTDGVEARERKLEEVAAALERLAATRPVDVWRKELGDFEAAVAARGA